MSDATHDANVGRRTRPLEERVVAINRVAKVSRAAGGSRSPRSSSWATAPDGSASATARPRRCRRRSRRASRWPSGNMFDVPMMGIDHPARGDRRGRRRRGAAQAGGARDRRHRRRPGPRRGRGAGIKDILSKSLGSSNPINIVHATMAGLRQLRRPEEIAAAAGPRAQRGRAQADARGRGGGGAALKAARRRGGQRATATRAGRPMTKLKVTQVRSVIDRPKDQKDTVRALGLHRITRLRGQGRPPRDPRHDRQGAAPGDGRGGRRR